MEQRTTLRIRNLTPHDIHIRDENFKPDGIKIIPKDPVLPVPRLETKYSAGGLINNEIVLNQLEYGYARDMPEQENNTLFIVSRMIAERLSAVRTDLVFADQFIRDENGRVIAAKCLCRPPRSAKANLRAGIEQLQEIMELDGVFYGEVLELLHTAQSQLND